MVGKAVAKLKALAGTVKANITEIYTALFIMFGLPLVAYLYVNLKLAVAVFVLVNCVLGLIALRGE